MKRQADALCISSFGGGDVVYDVLHDKPAESFARFEQNIARKSVADGNVAGVKGKFLSLDITDEIEIFVRFHQRLCFENERRALVSL